jgi:D-glycero-D-manno-heptose 1,7-bisphosphate phosphatase
MNKCIFLDRDGVLNKEVGTYVHNANELEVLDGVGEALAQLKQAGYLLIVITNQSGIAKGLYTREHVKQCHQKIQDATGNLLDDIYYCPHHEDYDTNSLLKKPNSLMIEKALAKYHIDPRISYMIGDQKRDIDAGRNVGLHTISINKTVGETGSDFAANSLIEATLVIEL